MRVFFVVVLAVCIAGVCASILEQRHKDELRKIRNVCISEANLNPIEIFSLIRAARPAEKLVDASRCIVDRLIASREDNKVVAEMVDRYRTAILSSDSSKVVNEIVAACQKLLGSDTCDKMLDLIGLAIEAVKRLRS